MARGQELLYAAVGIGDFAVEKATAITKIADRDAAAQTFDEFIKRGRTFSKKIRNSAATKQAVAQTKTARSQIKAASTSVSKAVQANVQATRSIAQPSRRLPRFACTESPPSRRALCFRRDSLWDETR